MIEVGRERLALWAANRDVDLQLRREVAWSLMATRQLAAAQDSEITVLREALANSVQQTKEAREMSAALRQDLAECARRADKQKGWATVGKAFVVGGASLIAGTAALILTTK